MEIATLEAHAIQKYTCSGSDLGQLASRPV